MKYLTPDNVTAGSGKKVWWLGKCWHEWKATINSRTSGKGCPYCCYNGKAHGDNCLAVRNTSIAKEWHPTKNGDLTPKDVTPHSNKTVWWKCQHKHEWRSIINNRSKGQGCPYCVNKKVCEDNCLAAKNPKLAKQWHPTKNGDLTPKDVTTGSGKKVWWKCTKKHEWQSNLCDRSKNQNCPFCSHHRVSPTTCLLSQNMEFTKEWHPTRNGKLTPKDVLPQSSKKVWWKCKNKHVWAATIYSRYNGTGCPYCYCGTIRKK